MPASDDGTFIMANYHYGPKEAPINDATRVLSGEGSSSSGPKLHSTLETTFLESHHDRVVLIQRWEAGDICPETNLPRTVEVQVKKMMQIKSVCNMCRLLNKISPHSSYLGEHSTNVHNLLAIVSILLRSRRSATT